MRTTNILRVPLSICLSTLFSLALAGCGGEFLEDEEKKASSKKNVEHRMNDEIYNTDMDVDDEHLDSTPQECTTSVAETFPMKIQTNCHLSQSAAAFQLQLEYIPTEADEIRLVVNKEAIEAFDFVDATNTLTFSSPLNHRGEYDLTLSYPSEMKFPSQVSQGGADCKGEAPGPGYECQRRNTGCLRGIDDGTIGVTYFEWAKIGTQQQCAPTASSAL